MSECKCSMRTKLVGDGCRYCNPDLYLEILEAEIKDLEQKLADAEKQNEWISEWNLEILEEGKGILRHSDGSGVVMNTLRDCPIAESLLLRFAKDVFKITPPQEGK